jgi:glycosyltransferase involved in cell wall biosynthesis
MWDMPFPLTFKNLVHNIFHSWIKKEYKKEGIIIHKIRRFPFFFPLINRAWFKWQIRRLYNKYKIDIIFSQSFINEIEPPLDLPLVYDMNDDHYAFAKIYGSKLYKLSYKILQVEKTIKNQIENAKSVTAVSDILVHKAKKYNKKVYKIANGVDEQFFNSSNIAIKKHNIIFVSTFGKWSKLLDVIKTINDLKLDYPDILLILVGDGPEIPLASKKVSEYGLEKNVRFYGKIEDRKKIIKLIQSAEVCLNISDKNAFRDAASPIKYLEYSALGKKIISTDLKEVKNLKFQNTIYYNENKSIKDLIIESFNNKKDYNNIRQLIKKHTWTKISKEIEKIMSDSI